VDSSVSLGIPDVEFDEAHVDLLARVDLIVSGVDGQDPHPVVPFLALPFFDIIVSLLDDFPAHLHLLSACELLVLSSVGLEGFPQLQVPLTVAISGGPN